MSDTPIKVKRAVYFWEDYAFTKLQESSVGRKGLSLFELKDMDIPIPDFFVVSPIVFDKVVSKAIVRDVQTLFEKGKNPEESEVLNSIVKTELDEEYIEEILSAYARISGFTDAWVSVRSSVVYPANPQVSFSGVFSTELNVRGTRNLIDSIKRIYASLFTDDVVAYAASKGVNLADVKLAVVVQKMVQAEVSGVAFTIDPITQDPTKLSIEAVFGLGDTIALGELTPDIYLINKKDLNILEKRISPQEWMKIRSVNKSSNKTEGTQKVTISNAWSHRQKVDDKYLKEISKIALIVENKLRRAQSIEWVMSGGKIWVLQSKDLYERYSPQEVVIESAKSFDTLGEVLKWIFEKYQGIGMLEDKAIFNAQKMVQSSKHEYNPLTEKLISAAKGVVRKEEKEQGRQTSDVGDLIIKGVGASFGIVSGNVKMVEKNSKVEVNKKDILVIKEYSSDMEPLIINSGGVILETGGITSDVAILCREFDIPAVVGATGVSSLLKEGQLVRLDGYTGSIYREKTDEKVVSPTHPVVQAYVQEALSGVNLLEKEEKKEEIVQPIQEEKSEEKKEYKIPHDMNLAPCATKVFIMPTDTPENLVDYVGNSHGIVYIDMDRIMIEDGRHLLAYVEDKKFVEYAKRISEKICEYVDLAEGNQVVLAIGAAPVSEFRGLVKGKQFENSEIGDLVHGLPHYLSNKELLNRVIRIVRRVRNVYKCRNVDFAVYSPTDVKSMTEFKKLLLSGGLRRGVSFRVYAILDNPSDVILADDILATKIDGLIVDMPRIAKIMQGVDIYDVEAKYDLGANSSLKVVDAICDISKVPSKELIVIADDSKELVRYSVQRGVYGVSVLPSSVKDMRKLVSEEEAKIILSKR